MSYPRPDNEEQRLACLNSYQILDSLEEQEYDDIVSLLAHICQTPVATIAFLDPERKWHKAKFGIDKEYVPREDAICAHTILGTEPLIVNDTLLHPEFCKIGMVVKAPYVRFYAGVPLISKDGFNLGTLCTVDTKPNGLNDFQLQALQALGRQVVALLELRKNIQDLQHKQQELSQKQQLLDSANQQLARMSQTDELSGLWNRRALNQQLLGCRDKNSLAMLMLDIDHFKGLNDSFGHEVGDLAICLVSELLQRETRDSDPCIRYGGDEFIVLMPEIERQQCLLVAQRICQQIAQLSQLPVAVTVSIGIAFAEDCQLCHQSLLRLADKSLYQAKHQGRDRVVIQDLG